MADTAIKILIKTIVRSEMNSVCELKDFFFLHIRPLCWSPALIGIFYTNLFRLETSRCHITRE